MAKRPLEFVKQDKLSELTKKATKNPDSADARKVVRELIARGLPVPKKLQKTIGKVRAEAGVGSPPRKVPRPKRKPAAPKESTQEELENDALRQVERSRNIMRVASLLNPVTSTAMLIAEGADALRGREDSSAQKQRPVRMRTPSDFERTPQRGGRFMGSPPLQRRADDIALPFNKTTGNRGKMRPPNVDPDLQRGVSRVPRGDFGVGSGLTDRAEDIRIGPSSPEITEAQFSYTNPGTIPTEDQFRAMRDTPRGSDTRIRDNMQADYVSSGGRSKGRGGIDAGLLEFIEFAGGRDAFKPDALDRGLASLGGGEVDDPMAKAEATYLNSLYEKMYGEGGEGLTAQEQSFMDNFGKKKGGRLKKKKPVARKKAAPKKKKVVAKKKPVVRKKAVAKKPPMRKKTVAKKPASRKRAAKRGFGAELRGN